MENETDLMDLPKLSRQDKVDIIAGVEQYCKKLERRAKDGRELGKMQEAGRDEGEAEGLREELVEPGPETVRIRGTHRSAVEKGLVILAHNKMVGKGTAKALGHPEWADQLQREAEHINETLLPHFQEQGSLPLSSE